GVNAPATASALTVTLTLEIRFIPRLLIGDRVSRRGGLRKWPRVFRPALHAGSEDPAPLTRTGEVYIKKGCRPLRIGTLFQVCPDVPTCFWVVGRTQPWSICVTA